MSRRNYIEVEVDMEHFDDEDIIDEMKARKLKMPRDCGLSDDDEDALIAVRDMLRRGNLAEAMLYLDRALNPKWQEQQYCLRDYERAKTGESK